jgi:ATP-binding cassette subfamily B protein
MSDKPGSDRPRARSLKPLRTLWPFITPYYRTLIAALLALLVASAAMLAMPVALRYLIDNGFIAQDLETVNRYFGWFSACLPRFVITW